MQDSGEHVDATKKTLRAWAQEWIAMGASGRKRRKVGARAVERYDELLRCHVLPTLGDRRLQSLQSTEIDKVYVQLEKALAPRTHAHVHSVLGACLTTAFQTKQIAINPMERLSNVPSPGESDHGIALEDEDLRKLVLGFRGTSLFPIVAALAFTGARRNEVLALRWSDLDTQKAKLRIERALEETKSHGIRFKGPKNEKHKRTISIDPELLGVLLRKASADRGRRSGRRRGRLVVGEAAGRRADVFRPAGARGLLIHPPASPAQRDEGVRSKGEEARLQDQAA
jgi:integrase